MNDQNVSAARVKQTVCFSIVSHGHGALIGPLLASIAQRGLIDPLRDQIIVTINIPEDEAFLVAGSALPIAVLRNPSPKGFGANHNAAFQRCASQVFCVLNPDLDLESLAPRFMFEVLEDPTVGAWAPVVHSPRMTIEDSARRFPTLPILFRRTFLKQRTNDYEIEDQPVSVDWVAGMFIAFRSSVYSGIRGFDESYHMYMEDVDICRRLGRAGLKVIYDPRTAVRHDARRDSRRKLKYLMWHLASAARFLLGSR